MKKSQFFLLMSAIFIAPAFTNEWYNVGMAALTLAFGCKATLKGD